MKKIDIVTYCTWTSIGSILQSLGLKKALSDMGCHSKILLDQRTNVFTMTRIRSVKSAVRRVFEMMIHSKRTLSYHKRTDFISQNMDIAYFSKYEELEQMADGDVLLAGSDQIWHPDHCNPVFFLDFAPDRKRVSYAASMGKTEVRPEKRELFGSMVNNFDAISVRERECVPVIQQYTDQEIAVHIDPTFLVSAEAWRQYEQEYKVKKPYILLYMLYWDKSCKEKIKALKKKTGLPVYAIANGLSGVYADKVLYDVGAEEFLWLIDHAEYVVTSSFHGAAFSTIFNKKFGAVINPASPSRIENLLRTLSLPLVEIVDLPDTTAFDYQTVNKRIAEEREKSVQYLKKVLE